VEVYQNLLEHVREEFTITTGTAAEGFMNLKQSFGAACDALHHRFYKKNSTLVHYDEAKNKPFARYDTITFSGFIEKGENFFDNCVKRDYGRLRSFLDELYTFIEEITCMGRRVKVFYGFCRRGFKSISPEVLESDS
jgi:hypothetical protein